MNTKKILFPTGFSTTSDACLAYATIQARETGATLIIAHVQEPSPVLGGTELYYEVPDQDRATLWKLLKQTVPGDSKVACEHRLLLGDPASEIIRLARNENVDLIVMGTHGRKGLTRLIMGSVAEAVVRRATCPVLTLKQAWKPPTPAGADTTVATVNLGSGI